MRCSSMETAPGKGPDDLLRASARDWFPVQLTGIRFQFVHDGSSSYEVPQGCVLGPVLFICGTMTEQQGPVSQP